MKVIYALTQGISIPNALKLNDCTYDVLHRSNIVSTLPSRVRRIGKRKKFSYASQHPHNRIGSFAVFFYSASQSTTQYIYLSAECSAARVHVL